MLAGGALVVTPAARELAATLLGTPVLRLTGPVGWFARLPTAGLLPPTIRAAYGLPWGARHALGLRLMSGVARRVLPRLPAPLRQWPAARAAVRRAAGAGDGGLA